MSVYDSTGENDLYFSIVTIAIDLFSTSLHRKGRPTIDTYTMHEILSEQNLIHEDVRLHGEFVFFSSFFAIIN